MSFSPLSHLLLCTKSHRGSHFPHAQFSLKYLKFSLSYTMVNMFGISHLHFGYLRVLKCEAVNFVKFESVGIPIRLIEYLDVPILIIAHVPRICAHDAHAHGDVTRFAYDVNYITMTSPAFMFHSCHVERRWHDVISVCIVGTPCHHGLHHMGMM